jgi:hypothetical protein
MRGASALRAILAVCVTAGWAGSAQTQTPCRLALVLGMDISSSVDPLEDALQRGGLARALRSPEVVDAILSTSDRPVALAMFEWSGRIQQDIVVPWTMLTDEAAILAVSEQIALSRRSYAEFSTAIGQALGFAHALFATGPLCDARTLDISGDGVNNDDIAPAVAYARHDFSSITVNGLAITVQEEGTDHGVAEGAPLGLPDYFRTELIRGPGSFVEVADGFEDVERAMRRKLLRELDQRIGQLTP